MGQTMFFRYTAFALATTALLALPMAARAEPGGCMKGAVAGGVAGHMVGSGHGKGGAMAGCAAGMARRHHARKEAGQNQQAQPQNEPTASGTQDSRPAPDDGAAR
ncbi:hypothetical protein AA16663_1730 [Komagataeibacter rhaeticus DSM 16663]|nr:hypothetical protein AA16663_1730 [Komagataeibacter rhaeticus DSM 16663]